MHATMEKRLLCLAIGPPTGADTTSNRQRNSALLKPDTSTNNTSQRKRREYSLAAAYRAYSIHSPP
jgi:hypothetical protein